MSNPNPDVTMTVDGATSEISSPTESAALSTSTATSSASSEAAASSSSTLSLASSLRDPPVLLSDGRVIPQSRCHFAWRRAVCVPEGGPSVLREWHSRNVRNLLQRVHGEQLGKATASLAKVAAVDAYTEAADVESIARLRTALERLKSTCAELDAVLASRGVSTGRDHAPPAPAQASDAVKAERAAEAERFKAAGGEVRKGVDGSMYCIRTVEDIWRAAGIPLTAQAADPSSPVERSDVASAADPRIPSAEPVSNAPVGVRPRPPTSQSPRGNAIWHADRDARGLSLTLPLLRERSKDLAQLLHSFDSAASDAPLQSLLLRCADDCRESSAALAAHGWSEADY